MFASGFVKIKMKVAYSAVDIIKMGISEEIAQNLSIGLYLIVVGVLIYYLKFLITIQSRKYVREVIA